MYASSAVHSDLLVGFDNAKIIGLWLILAISFIISSLNAPPTVDKPINASGLIFLIISKRFFIFSQSLAYGKCSVLMSVRDFVIKPFELTRYICLHAFSFEILPNEIISSTIKSATPVAA